MLRTDDPSIQAAMGWLPWARGDCLAAERCAADPAMPAWIVGFHCQQAIEKACKAMLVAKGIEPPRFHDLVRLAQVLEAFGLPVPPSAALCEALSPFAVADRYPLLSAPERPRSAVDPHIAAVGAVIAAVEAWLLRGP